MLKDEHYEDVTETFFQLVAEMPPGQVVASPLFAMLDSARAIEMGNKKLDTGMVELPAEKLFFDASAPQPVEVVEGVMNGLVVLVVLWTMGLLLPTTFYGLRYVVEFLQNLKIVGGRMDRADFVNRRMKLAGELSGDLNSVLVNKVLLAFVAGMCKFAGFVRLVALNVLFDEEDLTTRDMGFDLLSKVPLAEVLGVLDGAAAWAADNFPDREVLAVLLRTCLGLVRLDGLVQSLTAMFPGLLPDMAAVEQLEKDVRTLAERQPLISEPPAASISQIAQLECSNKHIPYEVYAAEPEKAYAVLLHSVTEIEAFCHKLASVASMRDLQQWLQYDLAPRMTGDYPVLARGLFQLYFIRDDRSIAGSEETVGLLCVRMMADVCVVALEIMDGSVLAELGPAANPVMTLMDDLETASYKLLSNYGNNRCRQRQFASQMIVLWDTLQWHSELIETLAFGQGVGDKLAPDLAEPALPLTCYCYHVKLATMQEVVLAGLEQHLYKPHEAAFMYWYCAYLAENHAGHLGGRVLQLLRGKLAARDLAQKRLKKTKPGPKKERLRARAHALAAAVPQVEANLAHLDHVLIPQQQALQELCLAVLQTLLLYELFGVDLRKPKSPFASDELLFNLRMKPWASVEVPPAPTLGHYNDAMQYYRSLQGTTKLHETADQLHAKFKAVQTAVGAIPAHSALKPWLDKLQQTCVAYQLVLREFKALPAGRHAVGVKCCYHAWFPVYAVQSK